MTLIEKPVAGQPMRAGWGASVAERLNQLGPFGVPGMLLRDGPFGQGSAPLPRNQRDRRGTPAAPQPYEVRWDPGLSNGDGGWKIYLPGEHLLRVDGEYIDELGGVTAIEDDNGDETGWFEFDEIDASATAIWLVVAKEESGNEGEATVSAQFAAEEGEGVQNNICIAEVSFTAATQSAAAVVEIRQSVVGALALTPGGEETPPKPFEYVETQEEGEGGEQRTVKSIVNLDFYWDGEPATATLASGFEVPATGNVFLCCVGTPSQSASAVHGYEWSFTVATSEASAPQGGKVANYKLYTFSGGEMTMDWRDTFLALWSGAGSGAEPDGVSIDKIPDAAPGTTPTGDEGKLEIKGFKSATSSELTLSPSSATTLEFLARNPGNPSSLVYRTLKISAADSATVKSGTIVATGVTWDTASGVNQYSIKITRGYLKVGDGDNGTTKGQIYVEEDPQETLTQRIPSVPFTPSMAQTS